MLEALPFLFITLAAYLVMTLELFIQGHQTIGITAVLAPCSLFAFLYIIDYINRHPVNTNDPDPSVQHQQSPAWQRTPKGNS